ncbi:MAG: hypothetical protein JSW11_19015 [Candidatus Heimdallarchaeota archaeon]|nr:MAG: hypothetical protein JSW11_19015 [Candidatus Heimdallarchaeota archaeon]
MKQPEKSTSQQKVILAFFMIIIIYMLNVIAILMTHTFTQANDMVHEPSNHYGSLVNAFNKYLTELDGAYQLIAVITILVIAYTFIQYDEAFPNKGRIQIIWSIGALGVLLLQIEIAFNITGILPPIIAILNFIIALVLLLIAYYLRKTSINYKIYQEMITRPHYLEYSLLGLVIFLSLPWIFAQLGFYISDFPILGIIFWARQSTLQEPEPNYPNAVHIGTHHGTEGFLIIVFLWIATMWILPAIVDDRVRQSLGAITGFGFGYAIYNVVEDFLTEQIYKRGWMDFRLPSGTTPGLNLQYLTIVLIGIIIYYFYLRRRINPIQPADFPK